MARTFLGFDDRGLLGFDLGDGQATFLPPTPDTTAAAMRLEREAGRDPAAVLGRGGGAGLGGPVDPALAAALPPRPSALGPSALAQAPASLPDGRQPSIMWDAPAAPQRPSLILDVDPAAPAAPRASPLPAIPAGTPIRIESGPGDTSALKASGASQRQIDETLARQQRQAQAPATAAQPTGPTLSAGDPSKGLVATPTAGAGGAAGGPRDPLANLNPAEREEYMLREARARAEAGRRPSAGTLVKGGKIQTGESWQGIVGPNADTVAAQRANAAETARLQRIQAQALGERDLKVAEIAQQQADYEQSAAQVQAEIAARKGEALGQIGREARALQQKIASAEIDPDRWWGSKSASDKALVGIAVALDGVVRGLTGRPGQPNAVLQEVYRQQDRDIDAQIRNVEKQRGDLNDLQRVYVQTKEQFGDEALAAEAAKLAGLAGFKAQIQAEAAKADAVQATDPVFQRQQLQEMAQMEQAIAVALGATEEDARRAAEARVRQLAQRTRSYGVRAKLLELDVDRKMLEQQAALEERMNGALSKSFGFTQDRVVGGSGGPSLDKIIADKAAQGKMVRSADEAAGKGEKEQKAVFVDGRPLAAAPGASQGSVDKAQDLISFADQGLDLVASAEARAKEAGGFVPGDPRLKIAAAGIASVLSNAQGGGAPNDNVMQTINDSLTAGPRQQAALQELRGQFSSAKKRALQRVGAAK